MTRIEFLVLASAQRRRAVTVRRTTVTVRPGHPIRRSLHRTVVVRPGRTVVAIGAPLVFLPAVVWAATTVPLPPRDRLLWQGAESLDRDEEWVDCNFGVDQRGHALFLELQGRAQLDFAEVTFANGNVQVVDFNEKTHAPGIYKLLDFADGRHVKTVRVLAQAKTEKARLTIHLS